MEQNAVLVRLRDLLIELRLHCVVQQEGVLNVSEPTRELYRSLIVRRDITNSQQFAFLCLGGFSQLVDGEDSGVLSFPIDAMNQEVNVGEVLTELALVLAGVGIVVLLVEGLPLRVPHQVL